MVTNPLRKLELFNKKLFLKNKINKSKYLYIYNNHSSKNRNITLYTDTLERSTFTVAASSYISVELDPNDTKIYFPSYYIGTADYDRNFTTTIEIISGAEIEHRGSSGGGDTAIIKITDTIIEIDLVYCIGEGQASCFSGGSI